jgi:uncharacterized protein with GYD domain
MATFISLVNLTQQGIRDFKDSPDRAAKFVRTQTLRGFSSAEMNEIISKVPS